MASQIFVKISAKALPPLKLTYLKIPSLNPAWVAVLSPACTLHVDLFQEPMEETLIERENDYVTIEEVVYEDSRLHNQKNLVCPFHKLTKSQARCLQVYFQWLKISVIYVKCLLSIILRFYILSVQRNDKMWLHLNFGSEQFGLLKWNFHGIFIHYQSLNCDLITFKLWLRTIWTFEMKFPWIDWLITRVWIAICCHLQEALYHAAENGYLDIALELRNMGKCNVYLS